MTNTLAAGAKLNPGASLRSSNGTYSLIMQDDGNLVIYNSAAKVIWSSFTQTSPGFAIMQRDGNFVLYEPDGLTPFWATGTNVPSSKLTLQDSGILALVSPFGRALWKTRPDAGHILQVGGTLSVGESLVSPDRSFRLVLQADGNLVMSQNGVPVWASNTSEPPGFAIMRWDGNFVLYKPPGEGVSFETATTGSGCVIALQNDGNLVVYEAGGSPLWDSRSRSLAVVSFSSEPDPAPVCQELFLHWNAVNASSVKLIHPDGRVQRGLEGSGRLPLRPCGKITGRYTLSAVNGTVSQSRSLNLALSGPPVPWLSQLTVKNGSGSDLRLVLAYQRGDTAELGVATDGTSVVVAAADVGECAVAGIQGWTGREESGLPTFSTDPFFALYTAINGEPGWEEFRQN